MTIVPTCPACGMVSGEVRCPRCNALKVVGCSGSCLLCKSSCKTDGPTPAPPSREAHDDDEHPGTPLER